MIVVGSKVHFEKFDFFRIGIFTHCIRGFSLSVRDALNIETAEKLNQR